MNSRQYSTIQLRRGSSSTFNSVNPVLASGEPAYAVDTQTLKIGDGINNWNTLIPITSGNITSYASNNTNIYSLGTVSGTLPINYATDRMIQTFNINQNSLTLTTGSGWPTSNISNDVLLQISCVNPATISWNIVGSNWYNKPAAMVASGEYLVLLRAMGSGIIQGHYIGNKQGSL
jgi:hypothetical protein